MKVLARIAISALTLVAVGCGVTSDGSRGESSGFAPPKSADSELAPVTMLAKSWDSNPQLPNSVVIALDADMSAGAARSGESIRRGMQLAIEQINQRGGLLGRPLELIIRDHRGNPDRGVDHIHEFAALPNLLAVFSGIHTPVAIRQLVPIHENQLLFLVPWAAGTPIIDNGYQPNYAFRCSARDQHAGEFLVQEMVERGWSKPALLLEQTPWGRSSERAILAALQKRGLSPAIREWLFWGETQVSDRYERILKAMPDTILLVCNPIEGASVAKHIASQVGERRLPVLSHWGISATDFVNLSEGTASEIDLFFLQTRCLPSILTSPLGEKLIASYVDRFDDSVCGDDIFCPPGTVHSWELMHMLELAVNNAQSLNPSRVRQALEDLRDVNGTIRTYERPFQPSHHDALGPDDLIMARFTVSGSIVPAAVRQEN